MAGDGIDVDLRMSSGALPPSAPMLTNEAALASGWSRRPQSCGSTESNSGCGGESVGLGGRNPSPALSGRLDWGISELVFVCDGVLG